MWRNASDVYQNLSKRFVYALRNCIVIRQTCMFASCVSAGILMQPYSECHGMRIGLIGDMAMYLVCSISADLLGGCTNRRKSEPNADIL